VSAWLFLSLELKAVMLEVVKGTVIIGGYKLSYLECTRKDIDKKRKQTEHGEIYAGYLKETNYRRFIFV